MSPYGSPADGSNRAFPESATPRNSEPILALDHIAVRHRGRAILTDVSLTFETRGTVVLLGSNGAGKSTLLHVAALLRRPDEGVVRIGGNVATPRTERRLRRSLALVPQHPLLFATTVLANAAAGLRFAGLDRREAERRALTWLERFGVAHLAGRDGRRLSGGEVQRVALARAFALEPALLLLDEPFAGLDAPSRDALVPLLAGLLGDRRASTLLVTHDLDEALALADRVGVLVEGRLVQFGAATDVRARPATPAVARLAGVENLLSGRVRGAAGETVRVELEPGGAVISTAGGSPAPAVGSPVTLAVAAARVVVTSVGATPLPDRNRLPGIVRSVTPGRVGVRLLVDVGQEIVVWERAEPAELPRPGDPVTVEIPPTAIHLLPTEA